MFNGFFCVKCSIFTWFCQYLAKKAGIPLFYRKRRVNILFMKKDIHPENFRPVIFEDVSNGAQFLIGSIIKTSEKGKFEGKEYDLFKVEISSASHPFYTGKETVLDTAGRVDKFKKRAAATGAKAKKGAK